MSQTIFGAAVPALPDLSDGVDIALGTRFTPAVNGTVSYGRWRFPDTIPHASTQVVFGLYLVSGPTLLASASFPLAATLGAWNQVALTTPVPVTAGTTYAAVVWSPNRYVATSAYPFPVTSGDLTAVTANGWFTTAAGALAFPTTQYTSGYFADVVFDPAAPSTWSYGYDVRVG